MLSKAQKLGTAEREAIEHQEFPSTILSLYAALSFLIFLSLRPSHKCTQVAFLRVARAKGRMVSIELQDVDAGASLNHHVERRGGLRITNADQAQHAVL